MGTQTAFTILSIGNVKAKIAVPENEIPMLSINDKAVVEIPVLGKDAFVGNIIEKGVDGNKLTHTYDVKISLNNSEHKILPGMVCNISIAGEETSFFVLPNNSIQIGSNNDRFVWCMKNGKATAVKVTLGELTANGVMVVNGLSQNDIVIIEGMQKVSEIGRASCRERVCQYV